MGTEGATLATIFESQTRKYGTRAFLKDKHEKVWRDHSWSEISDSAQRLRSMLIRSGLQTGDRVAILADNCPEWVVVDQAVLGMGGIVVPLYTTSGAEETRHVITDSGARMVAVKGRHLRTKLNELGSPPAVQAIIAMDDEASDSAGAATPVIALRQTPQIEPMAAVPGNRDDLATFIYTSGTTGMSKGVMLTHGNLIANAESNLDALALNERDMTLSFLPVAHSFERTAGHYTVIAAGGTIAYAEGLSQIPQNLLEVEPTVVLTVPRLLEIIHQRVMRTVQASTPVRQRMFHVAMAAGLRAAEYRNHGRAVPFYLAAAMAVFRRIVFEKVRGIFGRRLRYLISGGAPLPAHINRMLAAAELPIVEGYGLTEASPVVSCNLLGRSRIGTVGQPLKNVKVRTASDGELLVYGPNVMKGYYGREEETREAIDTDGWLHTGDIAEIDPEGYIRITDRKKEIIVLSGGKNVSPANLENALVADPLITQACVIGDRRKHLAAILIPDFEHLAQNESAAIHLDGRSHDEIVADPRLRELFNRRLREFNRQRSDVERITDFILSAKPFSQENGELTPTQKVRRKIVQEHYRSEIEAMYRE